MADHITQVIERVQKATGYHATEILDEAQPPLQEILADFAMALLREGFEAGWHGGFQEALTEDTKPWADRCEEELEDFLTQRQQEKETR